MEIDVAVSLVADEHSSYKDKYRVRPRPQSALCVGGPRLAASTGAMLNKALREAKSGSVFNHKAAIASYFTST